LRLWPFDQTMNAFIGRRTRPSSVRCRTLLDDGAIGTELATLTVGDGAGATGREMASTGVGGGDDQLLITSLVMELITERTTSVLSRAANILGVGVASDDDDHPPFIMFAKGLVVSLVMGRATLFCDELIPSCLASGIVVSTLT